MSTEPNLVYGLGQRDEPDAATHMNTALSLDHAEIGIDYLVQRVHAPAHASEWKPWLEDLGFVSGERVRVTRKSAIGGDPIVARVGVSTYALKRAEAACIAIAKIVAPDNHTV